MRSKFDLNVLEKYFSIKIKQKFKNIFLKNSPKSSLIFTTVHYIYSSPKGKESVISVPRLKTFQEPSVH